MSNTAEEMKFAIKDFFSKSDQIRSLLRIWSHLQKKFFMENFIFCAVQCKRLFRSLSIILIYNSNVFWISWFYRFTDFTELRFVKVARIREFSGRHVSKFGRKTLFRAQSLVTEKIVIELALRNITSGIFLCRDYGTENSRIFMGPE